MDDLVQITQKEYKRLLAIEGAFNNESFLVKVLEDSLRIEVKWEQTTRRFEVKLLINDKVIDYDWEHLV